MSLHKELLEYYDSSNLSFIRTVPFSNIFFDDRAEYMCKYGCKNYQNKYSCPPYSNKLKEKIEKKNYKYALLFATTHKIQSGLSRMKLKNINHIKECEIQRISGDINNIFNNNNTDHIALSGGSCKKCRPCHARLNEPCAKPDYMQTSMEAVGIDCQRTMHKADFDFEMPNRDSINRCGCILSNEKSIINLHMQKRNSFQKYKNGTKKDAIEMIDLLINEYSNMFKEIIIIPINKIIKSESECVVNCTMNKNGYACPPYSNMININLWKYAIIWEWNNNKYKKNSYNITLKTIHKAFFSQGFYFALSLRDCYCDECKECQNKKEMKSYCINRSLLAPSMQSQGIDPKQFGQGKFGIELI